MAGWNSASTCDRRCGRRPGLLLQLAALHPGLAEQLAVLLLRHALAALLDDRTHADPSRSSMVVTASALRCGNDPSRTRASTPSTTIVKRTVACPAASRRAQPAS